MDNASIVPRMVIIDKVHDQFSLRVFGDLLGINKALFDFETRELHTPTSVTGDARHVFVRSLIYALTCAAEALELVDPGEGGPTEAHVEHIAEIINDTICVPPLMPSEFRKACGNSYEYALEDRNEAGEHLHASIYVLRHTRPEA